MKMLLRKLSRFTLLACTLFPVVMFQKPDSSLLVIQRGLILLTNHLESFRKRYAFHLRQWQLDSHIMDSHQKSLQDKHSIAFHIHLQPAGSNEKVYINNLYFAIGLRD